MRQDRLVKEGEGKVAFGLGGPLIDGVTAPCRRRHRDVDPSERLDKQAGGNLIVLGDED